MKRDDPAGEGFRAAAAENQANREVTHHIVAERFQDGTVGPHDVFTTENGKRLQPPDLRSQAERRSERRLAVDVVGIDFSTWSADDRRSYLADLDHSEPRWQPAERDIDLERDTEEELEADNG